MNTETSRSAFWAGWLLVAGSVVGWMGAFSPKALMPREEFASHEAFLRFAATHQYALVIYDGGFLGGVVLTLLGFTALTATFRSAGERLLSELGLVSYLLGTV